MNNPDLAVGRSYINYKVLENQQGRLVMDMIEPRLTRKRKASLVPLYAMSTYESITQRQTNPILVPQAMHDPI